MRSLRDTMPVPLVAWADVSTPRTVPFTVAGVNEVPHEYAEEPLVYGERVLFSAKVRGVPTVKPLVASCKETEPVPVPTYFPFRETVIPVIVAPAGTLRPVPLDSNVVELLDARETVAKEAPVVTKLLGVVHATPEPCGTAVLGEVGPATALVPVATEAYAVVLEMLLGEVHEGPVIRLPTLGPTKTPEEDTAEAVSPKNGPSSAWATAAVNVPKDTDSTNTSNPFRYD